MNKRIKFLLIVILFLVVSLVLTQGVLAWDNSASGYLDELAKKPGIEMYKDGQVSVPILVGKIIKGALGFLGILFLIIILYAGFTWMTAGGSEEDVTRARSLIKWSIIGIIVIVGAYAISFYVIDQIDKATNIRRGDLSVNELSNQEDEMLDYVDCTAAYCSGCGTNSTCCNTYPTSNCCSYIDGQCRVSAQF